MTPFCNIIGRVLGQIEDERHSETGSQPVLAATPAALSLAIPRAASIG
jgi:hypothetical protein